MRVNGASAVRNHATVSVALDGGGAAIVDAAIMPLLPAIRWRLWQPTANLSYAVGCVSGKPLLMHREVFRLAHGWLPALVDHRSRDGCDNRVRNLRAATNSQNSANCKLASNNTTGFKGVYFDSSRGMWRARIEVQGVSKSSGRRFRDAAEAAAEYDRMATLYFGEFASTNYSLGLLPRA